MLRTVDYGAITSDPTLLALDPVLFVVICTTVPGLMMVDVSVVDPKAEVPLTTHVPIIVPATEITKLSALPAPGAVTIAQ